MKLAKHLVGRDHFEPHDLLLVFSTVCLILMWVLILSSGREDVRAWFAS
jgi:hypothetical protein